MASDLSGLVCQAFLNFGPILLKLITIYKSWPEMKILILQALVSFVNYQVHFILSNLQRLSYTIIYAFFPNCQDFAIVEHAEINQIYTIIMEILEAYRAGRQGILPSLYANGCKQQ